MNEIIGGRQPFTDDFGMNYATASAAGAFPLDARTNFATLEQALEQIPPSHRFKGQKFTVKGKEGEKPIEYWFIEDFAPQINHSEPIDGNWDNWDTENWVTPAVIPQPELYQPGGGELPPLSGETIMASLDPNFPYKSLHILVQKELLYNGVSVWSA